MPTPDKAFELIFRDNHRMITSYLYSLTGNWEQALDLTQEVFLIAYRKMDEFDSTRSLSAWLRGIAKNLSRNAIRKTNRARMFLVEGEELDELYVAVDDPDADGTWEERLLGLDKCLDKLPASQRRVVNLFYLENKSAREVSSMLGVVEKTVFQFLWQARRNLRQCLRSRVQEGNP